MMDKKKSPKKTMQFVVDIIKKDYGIDSRKKIGYIINIKESTLRQWCENIPGVTGFREPYKVLCLFRLCFDANVIWSDYLEEIKKYTDWSNDQYAQLEKILEGDCPCNEFRENIKKCVCRMLEYSPRRDVIEKRFPNFFEDINGHDMRVFASKSQDSLAEEQEKLKSIIIAKGVDGVTLDDVKDPMWLFRLGSKFYLDKKNKDLKVAFQCFHMSAELGYAGADLLMGNCYADGTGCKKDVKKAIEYYEKGVSKGDIDCQLLLGDIYSGKNEEMSIKADYEKAFKYYKEAAERGNIKAKFETGFCYYFGNGIKKDWKESNKYLIESIGDVLKDPKSIKKKKNIKYIQNAYGCLSQIYKKGGNGVEQDLQRSEIYLNESYEYYKKVMRKLYEKIFKKSWKESNTD